MHLIFIMRFLSSQSALTKIVSKEYPLHTPSQLSVIYNRSEMAFKVQTMRTIHQKRAILDQFIKTLEREEKSIMKLIARELGKPIYYISQQMLETKHALSQFAQELEMYLGKQSVQGEPNAFVRYAPLGSILFVPSWRFSVFQTLLSSISNLALGNCVIMHTPYNLPAVYERIQSFIVDSGWNAGEYQGIITNQKELEHVLDQSCIAGVHYSGKEQLGKLIAARAGKRLIKSVIRMEGTGSFAVLRDADIAQAVKGAVKSICQSAGQECYSPKVFLVAKQVYEKFKWELVQKLKTVIHGDPSTFRVEFGPIIGNKDSNDLFNEVAKIHQEWRVVWRSKLLRRFFRLTVFETDQNQNWDSINLNKLIGPVICLKKIEDAEQMLEQINHQQNNLYSICYGKSIKAHQKFLDSINTGSVWFNELPNLRYNLPVGGIGKLGYGRDGGIDGFREFANVKLYYRQ